ncbi:cell division protein anillin-domain-containing protein [Lipomyces orientalis]|uniref:Cell division protein anillin-domain-containing protein n=1 Tax=Lipomyces orientalis TaxID=1233043 RepID=A0ACC3THX9_9ASCO
MSVVAPSKSSDSILSLKRDSTDTAPVPPLRSPKRSPARARVGSPLSEVPSNDSRRNSPSTADHHRYLQQQQQQQQQQRQQDFDKEAQKSSIERSVSKSLEPETNIELSPRTTHSVMSFWQDKERENSEHATRSRSPAIDGSPIINSRVRNSIFHQQTGSFQRQLPPSPVLHSSKPNYAESFEVEREEEPATFATEMSARPHHVTLEKRSSLLSSSGSIRSKKVTFEMAPPQVLEFESTQDPANTPDATSEDSDEDEVSESPHELEGPNYVITKPASPLMKFESAFSSGVYLHRTPSGSRSLPKPSVHAFIAKGRPLPAVPTKQANPSDPHQHSSEPAEIRQSATSLVRQDSLMSRASETSSYDAMDLVDSYTFEDVNIDNEQVLDAFQCDSECDTEYIEKSLNDDNAVAQSSIGTLLTSEAKQEEDTDTHVDTNHDSNQQIKANTSVSDHSPEMSYLWDGETPASSTQDVSDDVDGRASSGYAFIEHPEVLSATSVQNNSTHIRTDSTTSFKLELSFEEAENDFGSGLNDYLNSSSFLANRWMGDIDDDPATVRQQRQHHVPTQDQTIKSSSGAKTRPSLTPADVTHMATTRRKVSGERAEHKFLDFPAIEEDLPKPRGQKPILLDLDMDDFSFDSLNKEFDRVMEVQRRGYMMRQNTKIVYASADHDFNDASPKAYQPWIGPRSPSKDQTSPAKVSAESNSMLLPETERERKDGNERKSSTILDDREVDLVKPSKQSCETQQTLPVASSNVQRDPVPVVAKLTSSEADDTIDPADRGRLFVKVLALKDLKLPLNDDSSAYFTLTLDNGIHCVTTAYMNLTRNAPIYQEFELIVGSDLEFILTLKAKISRPATPVSRSPSPKKKESRFGIDKLFSSPKRRTQVESVPQHGPRALDNILGSDGSFARSYVSFSQIEREIYLTSKILEVPCYNEWATEIDASRSRKAQRMPTAPYPIGKIVLQLLYYPKTHRNQEIPRSLNACLRELKNVRN